MCALLSATPLSLSSSLVHAAPPSVGLRPPVARLPSGVVLPYPTTRLFRGFGPCLGHGRHRHEAIDLGGIGPDGGVGTPVRSMVKAKVVMIGSAAKRPEDFGAPYKGRRPVERGGRMYPGNREIPGYGKVYFFTARRGKWRSGNIVATVGLEAPLEGARIRYMHLAAVRPELEVGDVVEAGDELGLLGGTGVQSSGPHVHIDVRTADERPVDVAPLLGLAPSATCGDVHDEAIVAADNYADDTPVGPEPAAEWPAGPEGDARPALALEPPPPPWRAALNGPAVELAAVKIEVPDCGGWSREGSEPTELRTSLYARRWLELAFSGGAAGGLELWDRKTQSRLMPGATMPVVITETPAHGSIPAKLRLVVATTVELAIVVRASTPWRLDLDEKCKRTPAAASPTSAPAPAPAVAPAP